MHMELVVASPLCSRLPSRLRAAALDMIIVIIMIHPGVMATCSSKHGDGAVLTVVA
jgi:hypothetical protein